MTAEEGSVRREEGGMGSGTQNFVHQNWLDKGFPFVNFVLSRDGHSLTTVTFPLRSGGGVQG